MNRKISMLIITLAMLMTMLWPGVCVSAEEDGGEGIGDGLVVVAENESLELSVDLTNCYVYIENKADGTVRCTNPENPEENEYTAPITLNAMRSQLIVTYFDENKKSTVVNTYTRCVMNNAFEIRKIKNGLLVTYNFSDEEEQFKIPLQYILNDDVLEVTVPADKIIEDGPSKISEISVLPFFMCGNVTEEGYALIPDGSGALIDFSSVNPSAPPYCEKVYGRDTATAYMYDTGDKQAIRMPVYGLSKENGGIFAVISSNEASAYICANQTGYLSDYTNVYASFIRRQIDMATIAGKDWNYNEYTVTGSQPSQIDMTVSYRFLTAENCDYSAMANLYRSLLVAENGLQKLTEDTKAEAVIYTFGVTTKKASFLGIPYNKKITAATFDDVDEMLRFFSENGIDHMNAMLYGFGSEGYRGQLNTKADYHLSAGGQMGYNRLIDNQKSTQNILYTVKNLVHDNNPSFLFFRQGQYAKSIDNTNLRNTGYLRSTYAQTDVFGKWYSLRPEAVYKNWKKYIARVKAQPHTGVAMEALAAELYSDFNASNHLERQEVLNEFRKAMELTADIRTAFDGGNIYAVQYVNLLYDLPLSSSGFDCETRPVPFYSMALHGYVNLASVMLNVQPDENEAFLQCVESGIIPTTALTECDNFLLQDTNLEFLYNTNFVKTKDKALERFKRYKEVTAAVFDKEIIRHERIGDVSVTTYENGYKVIVNHGTEACEFEGQALPGGQYILTQ